MRSGERGGTTSSTNTIKYVCLGSLVCLARAAVRDHLIRVVDDSLNELHTKTPILQSDLTDIYAKVRFRANTLGDADMVLDAKFEMTYTWFGKERKKEFPNLMSAIQYRTECYAKMRSIGNVTKAVWYEVELWPGVDTISVRAEDNLNLINSPSDRAYIIYSIYSCVCQYDPLVRISLARPFARFTNLSAHPRDDLAVCSVRKCVRP